MSLPIFFQRFEGAAIFLSSTYIYFDQGLSFAYFVLFLLAVDIFVIGYLVNNRFGAISYNIGHSLIAPALVIIPFIITGSDFLLGVICIWFAHIGLDRALGYGLKLEAGFKHTHLGDIGR